MLTGCTYSSNDGNIYGLSGSWGWVNSGGGGNKALYQKFLKGLPNGVEVDYQHIANKVFETIAMAKVSTSGEEARENNFLNFADGISVNPDHQLYDAKQAALALYEAGYQPPVPTKVPVVGASGYGTLLIGAQGMFESGFISEHDLKLLKISLCYCRW